MLTVAIIGRPNVGKSTLFNRLVGRRLALVDDTPGVTRDRREGEARLLDLRFRVFDTAGLEDADDESLAGRMRLQTEAALVEADVTLFVIDARAGITAADEHFAGLARKSGANVILVANKCEGRAAESGLLEAYSLGLGEPVAISAEHGEGTRDLYEALQRFAVGTAETVSRSRRGGDEEEADRPLRLAIVGRPNVGKSTLVNHLLGHERLLTGPEPGITRDSVSVDWLWQGRQIRLVDTAGLRRRARVSEKIEKLSAADTRRTIDLAEVVVLVMDAGEPMHRQDLGIARQVLEEGRALVLAINKWDAVKDRAQTLRAVEKRVEFSLAQARGIPIVTFSALTGRHVERLMPAVLEVYECWNKRISTGQLNRWLARVLEHHPPPMAGGRRLKLRYVTQAKRRPPTFAVFANKPGELPESYLRYLVNSLRETFDLWGVPVRIHVRGGKNPYVDEGS